MNVWTGLRTQLSLSVLSNKKYWSNKTSMIEEITNEKELIETVNSVGASIQMIHDYLAKNPQFISKNRIRFPRGFIRQASYFRDRLSFVENGSLKSNLSYNMMLTD